MYTTIPRSWRDDFGPNVTIMDLNDSLVQLHIPTIVFIAILMVLGVTGNSFVLYIYTRKYHPSTYRSFILWLGWIDLIACSVGMPLLIVSMLYPYMFPSEEACKTLRFLHVFFVVSSAFIVIAIAIERHRRICYPFSVEMSPTKIKIMCFVASVLGCLVAIPAIFVFGDAVVETGVYNLTGVECFIDPKFKDSKFPQGYFMFQLVLTLISMLIMAIFYFRIGTQICSHHQFIRDNTYNRRASDDKNKGKIPDNYSDADEKENNGVENGHGDTRDSILPKDSARISRETSPGNHLHVSETKKDPYGDLVKKIVKIKSRSASPATPRDSRESTPREERMRRQRSRLESNKSEKSGCTGPSLRTKQVTFMLFVITLVFILSFIPHVVLMVINSMNKNFVTDMTPTGIAFYNVFLRSFVINNMANPIIYGFCDKKFRSECADLIITIITCGQR